MNNIIAYRELIRALVQRDLKVRYKSSLLGYTWTWLDPLLTMSVFLFVFNYVLKMQVEHFPVFLLCGLIPWTFFSNSLSAGVSSLTANTVIIKKVYYPREIFPLVTVLSNGVNMFLSLLVLIPIVIVSNISLSPKVMLLPFPILLLLMMGYGLALIASIVNVYFRDMAYIIPFLIRLLLFLTPVFYQIEGRVPETMYKLYMSVNPMATLLTFFRACLMGSSLPEWKFVGVACGFSLLALWLGFELFKRYGDSVIKRI